MAYYIKASASAQDSNLLREDIMALHFLLKNLTPAKKRQLKN
jgi:hypothetical protein